MGPAPERGELRRLKLENRKAKVLVTRGDLQRAWNETAARFDYTGRLDQTANIHHPAGAPERALEDRVEERLTERAATFEPGELRAVLLEQSVGELAPTDALALSQRMIAERRILPLEGSLMTTLALRAQEQTIEQRFTRLANPSSRDVGEPARSFAADRVAERIGGRLTDEQAHALQTITGPERAAFLVGPAGTGKGVVIDAAARAEQMTGHHTLGIAVSGSTAQRLGQDSPALAGQTLTLDALVARVNRGQLQIGEATTIYFDEAGMGDTDRFARLTEAVAERGAKLVAIGDAAQLPSIGAGGMFDRLARIAPSAELSNVRRTLDPAEQRAWADLRAGRSDRAMAHYYARGLHMADTRDQAVEQAVQNWAALSEQHQVSEVALILRRLQQGDSPSERPRATLPRPARRTRRSRGPGARRPLRHPRRRPHSDDRPRHETGVERIENGARGEVLDINDAGEVLVQYDVTSQWRTLSGDDLARLRLGYAQHIHRAQGATVTRTLVVTGGWQTSKEPAYVEASRARQGTDWYVSRQDLGPEGHDTDPIKRLAQHMNRSHAQTPSLAHPELPNPEYGSGFQRTIAPSRSRLPGLVRAIHRIAQAQSTQRREHDEKHGQSFPPTGRPPPALDFDGFNRLHIYSLIIPLFPSHLHGFTPSHKEGPAGVKPSTTAS